MFRRLLERLDKYGTDDPDFNEGHATDRCPVCPRAVDEHPTWQHRRAAAVVLLTSRWK